MPLPPLLRPLQHRLRCRLRLGQHPLHRLCALRRLLLAFGGWRRLLAGCRNGGSGCSMARQTWCAHALATHTTACFPPALARCCSCSRMRSSTRLRRSAMRLSLQAARAGGVAGGAGGTCPPCGWLQFACHTRLAFSSLPSHSKGGISEGGQQIERLGVCAVVNESRQCPSYELTIHMLNKSGSAQVDLGAFQLGLEPSCGLWGAPMLSP